MNLYKVISFGKYDRWFSNIGFAVSTGAAIFVTVYQLLVTFSPEIKHFYFLSIIFTFLTIGFLEGCKNAGNKKNYNSQDEIFLKVDFSQTYEDNYQNFTYPTDNDILFSPVYSHMSCNIYSDTNKDDLLQ